MIVYIGVSIAVTDAKKGDRGWRFSKATKKKGEQPRPPASLQLGHLFVCGSLLCFIHIQAAQSHRAVEIPPHLL
jgi:hypothetical protein